MKWAISLQWNGAQPAIRCAASNFSLKRPPRSDWKLVTPSRSDTRRSAIMIPEEMVTAKAEVESTGAQLWQFMQTAAQQATAAHVVEEELFRKLLGLGRSFYGWFLALQGTGDLGERFTLTAGRQL